jgi:hypothetical protein
MIFRHYDLPYRHYHRDGDFLQPDVNYLTFLAGGADPHGLASGSRSQGIQPHELAPKPTAQRCIIANAPHALKMQGDKALFQGEIWVRGRR